MDPVTKFPTHITHIFTVAGPNGGTARIVKCTAATTATIHTMSMSLFGLGRVECAAIEEHRFTEAMSMSNRKETMFCDERLLNQRYR